MSCLIVPELQQGEHCKASKTDWWPEISIPVWPGFEGSRFALGFSLFKKEIQFAGFCIGFHPRIPSIGAQIIEPSR